MSFVLKARPSLLLPVSSSSMPTTVSFVKFRSLCPISVLLAFRLLLCSPFPYWCVSRVSARVGLHGVQVGDGFHPRAFVVVRLVFLIPTTVSFVKIQILVVDFVS